MLFSIFHPLANYTFLGVFLACYYKNYNAPSTEGIEVFTPEGRGISPQFSAVNHPFMWITPPISGVWEIRDAVKTMRQ